MRGILISFLMALFFTPLVLSMIVTVGAQVRQSSSYRLESDSINFGGGFSSSTNYSQESTAGEIATGPASSTSYNLRAGYQQMGSDVYLAMNGGTSTVTMTPTIGGVSGGTSNGSTTVTVITDNSAGYQLDLKSSASPALQSGLSSIADYVPSGANPDFTFTTTAVSAQFGFSPEGINVVQRYLDNGSSCNVGSSNTTFSCWDGLSTSYRTIASGSASNYPSGATTTVYFRVGIGGSVLQQEGTYTATTTFTAIAL